MLQGAVCTCPPGEVLKNDSHDCEDLNECEPPGRCSQQCTNTKGSYYCSCVPGYTLEQDKHTCKAISKTSFLYIPNVLGYCALFVLPAEWNDHVVYCTFSMQWGHVKVDLFPTDCPFFLVSIDIVNSPTCFQPIIIAILRENIDAPVSSFFLRTTACCTAYSMILLTVPPSKQNFPFLFFPPHCGVI